jgi:hypothetical protein
MHYATDYLLTTAEASRGVRNSGIEDRSPPTLKKIALDYIADILEYYLSNPQ